MDPSPVGSGKAGVVHARPSHARLIEAYEAYCRREGGQLLALVPRDELREFYGRARAWASRTGKLDEKDPIATATAYCRHLLPLPPFAVWCRNLRRDPSAYLDALAPLPGPTAADGPWRLDTRRVGSTDGSFWDATLHVLRGEVGWKGFIRFEGRDGREAQTAAIFREESTAEIRNRFLEFHPQTLAAFLRSALP